MALNLEKRLDGTFFFRRTYVVDGKQKAIRTSLKTKSYKTAKILAIQILASVEMDKLLQQLLSNPNGIRKFEVEYDDNRNLKKLKITDDADKQNFLEVQEKLESQRKAEHERAIELIKLQNQIVQNNSTAPSTPNANSLITTLIDEYLKNISVTKDVASKYKRVLDLFVNYCTSNNILYINQVSRRVAFMYLTHSRATKKDDKTIKNYFGVLNTFWNYQVDAGETELASPFSSHKFNAEEEGRDPFTLEELNKIFASDFVTKNNQNKFILLLLLTTGARPNEICQLWTDDIYQSEDEYSGELVWVIRITKNTERKQTLKTKDSNRLIYLHKLLINEEFLTYLKSKPFGMLFKLNKPSTKTWSVFFSNDFSELLKNKLNINGKVLYCFRHTINNRLKDKMVDRVVRENLLGHKPTGTNETKYSKPHSPLNLKKATEVHLFFEEVPSINSLN